MNNFHIAAGVIAENQNGQILMVQEGKEHVAGTWNFPGGQLEQDETLEGCAHREFKEETGYSIQIKNLVGIYLEKSHRTDKTVAVFMYRAELEEQTGEREMQEEILEQEFFKPEEIEELDLRKENREKMLEDYRNGKSVPASRVVDTLN